MSKWRILRASIGTMLIGYHFWLNGFHLNLWGIVIYGLIVFGVALVFTHGKLVLKYYRREAMTRQELRHAVSDIKKDQEWFERYPWSFLLPMANEGIYALPLLYLGLTPISVLAFAFVFALPIGVKDFELETSSARFIVQILLLTIVLPMGIEAMVIGAGVNRLIGVFLGSLLTKRFYPLDEKLPLREVKGKRLVKGRRT